MVGIALGDSAGAVLHLLGAPDRRQESLGLRFWDFSTRGVSLTIDKADDRVHVIILTNSEAGAIDGVRVGDPAMSVRPHWGSPARVREHGRFLDFIRRGWTCTAELQRSSVVEITLTLARQVGP